MGNRLTCVVNDDKVVEVRDGGRERDLAREVRDAASCVADYGVF